MSLIKRNNALVGVAIGLLGGIVVGLFLAPDNKKKTLNSLLKQVKKVKSQVKNKLSDEKNNLRQKAAGMVKEAHQKIDEELTHKK